MPIRAVVFDIGGVLEFNPKTGWEADWAARLAIGRDEFAARLGPIWRRGSIGALALDQVEREAGEALGLACADVTALMNAMWAEYLGTLNRELAEYFTGLRPRYRTAMLSNSFVGAREREQSAYGFEAICDTIVYSHEVGYMKPDRRIYELVCERLGVVPAEVVFVDDVESNVAGALALGMRAIRFERNRQLTAALEPVLQSPP